MVPLPNYDLTKNLKGHRMHMEVPEPRVRKRPLSLTNRAFSSLSDRALPVPETKI